MEKANPSVSVSSERAALLAARLKEGPRKPRPTFLYSEATPYFPPRGVPWAAGFFFHTVLHLYGAWREDNKRSQGPLRGFIGGREFVGDAFLWKASYRATQEEPNYLKPSFQAALTEESWSRLFRDDTGDCPVPLAASHAALAEAFGKSLTERNWTANVLLQKARESSRPVHTLVDLLSEVPGYREDPYRRKSFLLALILASRPEATLPIAGEWPPILGRHELRLALRWGLLQTPDAGLARALGEGGVLPPPVEEGLRRLAYEGFARVLSEAGLSYPDAAGLLFDADAFCPEDSPPACGDCFFNPACERRTTLLAPAVRTLHY